VCVCDAFSSIFGSPSSDDHHWPKHVKVIFDFKKTFLHLMKFSRNFTYRVQRLRTMLLIKNVRSLAIGELLESGTT
jgi:hypothetical protein